MTPLNQSSLELSFRNEESLEEAAAQIAKNISQGLYDITHFVEQLGFALTSPSVDGRVNGTKILSHTLALLPKDYLNAIQLEFLTTFYADRLKDSHNVIPAVIDGIDALITMKQLPEECIPKLLRSFFQHTTCQSQVCKDRMKLFRILKTLSENHADVLKAMSTDFIYGVINSIDGERDPRNLDFIFSFMPDFIAHYPMMHLSEEMFEIFACYFPIDFYPSKNDPDTITRDNLAEKLANCLVASPLFAEWTIALALEKLESDLLVAKLDSLELLHQAALKFPIKTIEPHFESIWPALKREVFPGSGNVDLVSAGLRSLRTLLQQAARKHPVASHNFQTMVFAVILPHLGDVNQRLFDPSIAIALVCVAGDLPFASEKVFNTFLLKMQSMSEGKPVLNDEQRTKMYTIVAQIFKIASLSDGENGGGLWLLNHTLCEHIHADAIASLRRNEDEVNHKVNDPDVVMGETEKLSEDLLDLKRAALSVLNESVPLISEDNRSLIYRSLLYLTLHNSVELEFTPLLEHLGAMSPVELQRKYIDVCMRNFPLVTIFAKRKIFRNLLPLIKQTAFAQNILHLILSNVFRDRVRGNVRLIALEMLNAMLKDGEPRFVVELQTFHGLVDKLIVLAQRKECSEDFEALERISVALALIVKELAVSEQFMIATEHLPKLNLQLESDLFVAKGLLGFLHTDISLDDHFERLLDDLIALSMSSENPHMRQVAHHLMCSLVNKIDTSDRNRGVIGRVVAKLRNEIAKVEAKAVEALSWLGKGLIVRGYEEAGEIVEAIADLLDHPSLAHAAILAFEIISTEYPQLHLPIVRFLFKQKFFHTIIKKLENKLETGCENHLSAFIYVLRATPHPVLKMNIEKVGPIIFKSLESSNTQTLCIALEICETFIEHNDDYFRLHLQHLIPRCLELSKFKDSMKVRITALNLLYDMTKYPTFVLLPHKMDVVLDLVAALDDQKRLVRNAAVKARNAWYLVGSNK